MACRLVVLASLLMLGCGLKKSADEMKDTSKTIEKHSGHLGKRTNDLEYNMSKLYANQELEKQLEILFRKETSTCDNDDSSMFVAAGVAMHSMYFQTWKADHGEENLETLDERFKLSLEVLFGHLIDHIPSDYPVDVIRPSRDYRAVGALGVKLDQMDQRFAWLLERKGMPHLSTYNVLVGTLINRAYENLIPKATHIILTRKREAVYMLQLRHNLLPLAVVGRMTDLKDRCDFGRLRMWWSGQTVSLTEISDEEITEWIEWLTWAQQTRRDLRAMGIEPKYNEIMAEVVAGVDFGQRQLMMRNKSSSKRDDLLRQLAALYIQTVDESL